MLIQLEDEPTRMGGWRRVPERIDPHAVKRKRRKKTKTQACKTLPTSVRLLCYALLFVGFSRLVGKAIVCLQNQVLVLLLFPSLLIPADAAPAAVQVGWL